MSKNDVVIKVRTRAEAEAILAMAAPGGWTHKHWEPDRADRVSGIVFWHDRKEIDSYDSAWSGIVDPNMRELRTWEEIQEFFADRVEKLQVGQDKYTVEVRPDGLRVSEHVIPIAVCQEILDYTDKCKKAGRIVSNGLRETACVAVPCVEASLGLQTFAFACGIHWRDTGYELQRYRDPYIVFWSQGHMTVGGPHGKVLDRWEDIVEFVSSGTPKISVAGHRVVFNTDGTIKVGCQTISSDDMALLRKAMERVQKSKTEPVK